MNKKYVIYVIVAVLVVIFIIIFGKSSGISDDKQLEAEVQHGKFDVLVTVTGELQAKNSVKIEAPINFLREIGIFEISLAEIIPEGTVVNTGDFVARLDGSNVQNSLNDIQQQIENSLGEIEKAKIDSSLELRGQRDNILNLKYSIQEAEIALEQSVYESPAVVRKAKLDLEKIKRDYEQAVGNYKLKVQQAEVNIRQKMADLNNKMRQKDKIMNVMQSLYITAPAPGMIIYTKNMDGSRLAAGSTIQLWRTPVVATLPDLSSFISTTYVNEIDISKVHVDQPVDVSIDAFPDKKFKGTVSSVANVGEQLPNTDAKLFEVLIILKETDPILKPGMTTSNSIITDSYKEVNFLPLEAVFSEDSMTFVYQKSKKKKLVLLGKANETSVIVLEGLNAGEKVLLVTPENGKDYKLSGTELLPKIHDQIKGNHTNSTPKQLTGRQKRN